VKSGFFFASKRNKIFASISNFASEAKVRAHPICFAYQDDLEVASKDDIQHHLHLRQVFLRLRQHGLVINAEKCVFGAPSIDFLGHRVTAGGVTPLPTYVSAVLDFPRPNTVKELQGYFGLLNFYRRFLPAVARTLQPLTDALRGDRKGTDPVEWSAEMEAAFTASKKALASATYLAHPLPGAVLSLSVDASATHIGAGLHQRRPGSIHWEPLGFFSKKLEPAQTAFPSYAGRAAVYHIYRPQTTVTVLPLAHSRLESFSNFKISIKLQPPNLHKEKILICYTPLKGVYLF
jgi:hypothetical protein